MTTKQTPTKPTKATKAKIEDHSTTYAPPAKAAPQVIEVEATPTPSEYVNRVLMETLEGLRNRENPLELDRAKAIVSVASMLITSAKVENEYLRLSGENNGSRYFGIEPALLPQ